MAPRWPLPALRVGLGCMRLSTEADRDDVRGLATLRAARAAGITLFDTAHAYALSHEDLGHNERLLARAFTPLDGVRVVTKGGMTRPSGRWAPDGRARTIAADATASSAALGALAIDLSLLHAPDPAVPWPTSVRAIAALLERGVARHVGVANVTRAQLDEALAIAPIAAVQLELGVLQTEGLANGVVALCIERDIAILAHRPLGGVKRQRTVTRDAVLRALAAKHATTPQAIALAAVLDLHPHIVVLPGATRPETATAAAAAASIVLDDEDRAALAPRLHRARLTGPRPPDVYADGEVVLVMGLQGAGKTTTVGELVARGYERLNRDELGGSLAQLNRALHERLSAGARRVVLDNTYVTRAQRREVIDVAWRHRLPVRGVWLDTPLVDAQVNVVLRMLAAHGRLLAPAEMARAADPTKLAPTALLRTVRMLERPSADEGFQALDVVTFTRAARGGRPARLLALEAVLDARGQPRPAAAALVDPAGAPHLVFAWRPAPLAQPALDALQAALPGAAVALATCTHGGGPPVCWCRPPLPGMVLAFAHAHGVDTRASTLVGVSAAHRALAAAVGATFREP